MEWKKYILTTTVNAVDLISGVLMENGISSFEIEDKRQISEEDKKAMYIDIVPDMCDDGIAKIIFYMDIDIEEEQEKKVLKLIKEGIDELREYVDVGDCIIEESTTNESEWVDKWKEFFKPFTVDDILIRPTWEKVDNENDYKIVIKIDPGTSFGTGLHETTQLCIRQLSKYVKEEMDILDVGCGSGILSIAARKLGAKSVFGIDIDDVAVVASRENAIENDVTKNIEFISGNIIDDKEIQDMAGYDCYDIVVANILADVIMPLSDVIVPHLKVGGKFITSGIINTKEDEVKSKIELNENLSITEITRQNDWVSITAERIK